MEIKAFFDEETFTLTYAVFDEQTRDAVVIDPVLDYDPRASQTSTKSLDQLTAFIDAAQLRVHFALETHAHADHLSGSQLLRERYKATLAIGDQIVRVQETFRDLFDLGDAMAVDGRQFDRLLHDDEMFEAGSLRIRVIGTPGHTPACVTYKIEDAIFAGDALFMQDYGVGRCDFPRGSAGELYNSVHERLYKLPDATRVFVGHDYLPGGRELLYETTIGESKRSNPQLNAETSRQAFIETRNARDATLAAPRLLLPSVQVNANGGRLPAKRSNGLRYLSIPINALRPTDDVGRPE